MKPLTKQEYAVKIDKIRKKLINEGTDVSDDDREICAHQLRRMSYDPGLGDLDIDILDMDLEKLLMSLDKLLWLKIDDVTSSAYDRERYKALVKSGAVAEDSFLRGMIVEKIRRVSDSYLFLLRLRKDDPAAWDEVNEMYGED